MKNLSGHRILWLQVMFDLPTGTRKERHLATRFRNLLLDLGFDMVQLSMYLRHCANRDIADKYIKEIEIQIPEAGKVALLVFTDKQYENMRVFHGKKLQDPREKDFQFELF